MYFTGQQVDRLRMPLPLPTRDPLEQAIVDRMKLRAFGAPSMMMTAFVGGVIGVAAGYATDGKAARYGALGAAIGLAGGFAYGIYNSRVAASKALEEHQALLLVRPKPKAPPARGTTPHRAGFVDTYAWE